MSSQPSPTTCPHCSQSDKVQSASSAQISAPIKPSDTPLTFIKIIRWIFGGAFGLVISTFCVFTLGVLLLGGCSTIASAQYDNTGITTLFLPLLGTSLLPMLCIIPIVLIFGGGFTIGLPWLIYRYVNNNYKQRFSSWQRALHKYNLLYYCARCAGVFLKDQNRIVPIEQMQSFLYEIQISEPIWPYGG